MLIKSASFCKYKGLILEFKPLSYAHPHQLIIAYIAFLGFSK